jgi:hypothetical protein
MEHDLLLEIQAITFVGSAGEDNETGETSMKLPSVMLVIFSQLSRLLPVHFKSSLYVWNGAVEETVGTPKT